MKLFNFLFTLVFFNALAFNVVLTFEDHTHEEVELSVLDVDVDADGNDALPETESEEAFPGGRIGRFLAQQKPKAQTSCDKFPRLCRTKGSPGPDCCKKKCVNVMTDRSNCGMCGKKCKYSQICCKGKCVNPSFDKKNCGGCNKKCKKGEFCAYGMCNYA